MLLQTSNDVHTLGHKPLQCQSRHKVAIIVPFRDREAHLKTFLFNIHSFLYKQQLDYRMYVIEQAGQELFNKGTVQKIMITQEKMSMGKTRKHEVFRVR